MAKKLFFAVVAVAFVGALAAGAVVLGLFEHSVVAREIEQSSR